MRTKSQVHILTGHTATISDVQCQESDPQVITGSMDSTVRCVPSPSPTQPLFRADADARPPSSPPPDSLWDLAAGKTMTTLTHHHKSVRSIAIHPTEYSFATASAGGNNIKKWACPNGTFVHNFSGHDAIINSVSVNHDGVFFSGGASLSPSSSTGSSPARADALSPAGDNGSMTWWDYKTGLPFQTEQDKPQPGSLDAESGVFCSTFDQTGTRLIVGGADKTIKVRERTFLAVSRASRGLTATSLRADLLGAVVRSRRGRPSPSRARARLYFEMCVCRCACSVRCASSASSSPSSPSRRLSSSWR